MILKTHTKLNIEGPENRGFIALIAVILLASGTLAISLAAMSSAIIYADSVNKRELRIQARLNEQACLDAQTIMSSKDYLISGSIFIKDFGCTVEIIN